MISNLLYMTFFTSTLFFLPIFKICLADIDNLQDTCPTTETSTNGPVFINGFQCKDPKNVSPSDFKSTRLNKAGNTDNYLGSSMSTVTAAEFPGLNTLGLSVSRTDLEVDGLVATHSHPRASEIMFVSKGSVIVGFIDTKNNGFEQALGEGDVFIVPRGMMHYFFHTGDESTIIFSVLNSQNPGLSSITDAAPGPNAQEAYIEACRVLDVLAGKQDRSHDRSGASMLSMSSLGSLLGVGPDFIFNEQTNATIREKEAITKLKPLQSKGAFSDKNHVVKGLM